MSDKFSGTMPVSEKQRFDVAALEAWMRENVAGFAGHGARPSRESGDS